MAEIIGRIELPPKPVSTPDRKVFKQNDRTPEKWTDLVKLVCETEDHDKVIENRRHELIESFDHEEFISFLQKQIPDEYEFNEILRDPRYLKGFVFEYLVNKELNDDEENSFIGQYVLECLKNPSLIGLGRFSMRNPDHLGVVVDAEKGEAHITGMYEVKMGKLTDRARSQVHYFYQNVKLVIDRINEMIPVLREENDLIPPRGIQLKEFDDIYKFIVSPVPEDAYDQARADEKKEELEGYGWDLKNSIFTYRAMNHLTNYICRKEIKKDRRKAGSDEVLDQLFKTRSANGMPDFNEGEPISEYLVTRLFKAERDPIQKQLKSNFLAKFDEPKFISSFSDEEIKLMNQDYAAARELIVRDLSKLGQILDKNLAINEVFSENDLRTIAKHVLYHYKPTK